MNSKDDVKSKVTLESIKKRLDSLEKKIEKLPDKEETENYFKATLLISLAFVLVAVTIPLLIEILEYSKEDLWWVVIPYMIIIFGFMFVAGKVLRKK